MDEFSSGDQAPEWTSSSSDDSFSYEDEDSHQDVENIDNVESSIEKDDDKVTATMLWSSEFDKEVHAYKAYVKYARDMGFAVRKRDLSRDKDGNLNRKYYVCNRQGTRDPKHYRLLDRKRNHKPETRTGCKARCFIYLDKLSMKWRVKTLEEEHNHPMIPEQFVHLISNHRKLTEADKARIVCMKESGFQTSQIVGFLAKLASGYSNLNFTKKDVYNFIDPDRRAKIENGDAVAAISYLQGKADVDPMSVARYTLVNGNKLGNLFWADGLMINDYQYFGDVLAFDSTYKKNRYNKPVVIFSGSNNHRLTCIFGFAVLANESRDTYIWLLKEFLDVMMNKEPSVVVTDGDDQMRQAIKEVFPSTTHRHCAWHIEKNANSHINDRSLLDAFKVSMYANMMVPQFEAYWEEMIQKFDIDEDHWLLTKYANKAMWATAYLCGKFSAGVRTTSRCEGINSFLKRFIKSQETLLALVENLERVVKEYRNNELVAQFKSMYSKSVLTTGLDSIKQAAARVYTAEVFPEVKDQLAKVVALKHVGKSGMGSNIVHCVAKFRRLGRLYHVLHDDTSERIECECQHSQQSGIPCSHIFCVMRHEDICELPEHLVLKRWRKEANAYLNEEVDDGKDPKRAFALWYGSLWSGSIWMNFLVAKTTPTYRHTIGCVNGIIKDLEKRLCLVENVSRPVKDIQDLEIVKIRGAPKLNKKFKGLKTRNCSRCGQTGHTRRTCHNVESEKHCLTGDNGSEGEGHGSRFETGRHNSHDDDVAAKQGSLSSKFGLYSAGCDEVASDSLKNICKNSIPNYITVPK
ncbi:protein FAR1-RELATED SEQUENCE 5-like [Arachis ipaensis]|uniref:protein FAR1-RELATED SEQUENCE 5-like n=1 Tax=Arachis ipaensis TaxID=130454 RepID=UPI0007AF13B1|nr:protein FAR1-RELATED SEQUENCE 5-like [Arachis ipaensis]XP_025670492.1 protein FAR1-RELATED SEQUENCE 5-like [Arachis hypogaea]